MGIFSWIILGLLAGALAKWILPGRDDMGLLMTILLGISGAFVGGYIGTALGLGTATGLSIGNILSATAGALLLLFLFRRLKNS
jgi:uncharacterized membrane protein YeaQ/YmgE (transglycosylase-associated protein family)